MTTPKYGPSVLQQLCAMARDAAYDNRPLCLLSAVEEVGRALSGAERRAAQECYQSARAEMQTDREDMFELIAEIRREDDRPVPYAFSDDFGDEREIELYEEYP